jgi:hypothetical protein
VFTFDQFSILAIPYDASQPALPALEEVMEYFAELMQRLLEIQSGGTQRSAELITEHMDEVVVNLRRWTCYLFSLLRIHSPNCEHCNVSDTCWVEVKKRLEELR